MVKLTRCQADEIVRTAFDALGEVWYEPWEWGDMGSLPEGFTSWDQEGAHDVYFGNLHEKAVRALLAASRKKRPK